MKLTIEELAIEYLRNCIDTTNDFLNTYNVDEATIKRMQEQCALQEIAIKALEKQINDRWIPVTERLPEDYKFVLTCDCHGNMHIYSHYYKFEYPFGIKPNNSRYYMPVAWMPLPEPHKESEQK